MKRVLKSIFLSVLMLLMTVQIQPVQAESSSFVRYTVLILDTSAAFNFYVDDQLIYTANPPIDNVKAASLQFLKNVQMADGQNYLAIVAYNKGAATVVTEFTDNVAVLDTAINNLSASGIPNVEGGFLAAEELLDSVTDDNAIKNVVLFTTGLTCNGNYSYDGFYNENTVGSSWYRIDNEVKFYAYANSAIVAANRIKEKATLYSIGLFQTMKDMPEQGMEIAKFFKLFAGDCATSPSCFYDVEDPNALEFVFGQVGEDVTVDTGLKKLTFNYNSGYDYSATCYYSNDYFAGSAYDYNSSLATMSMSLAWSAYASAAGGYAEKSQNVQDLLKKIGIPENKIRVNDAFKTKPTTDSIGAIVGSMPVKLNQENFTLITLAIRGGYYEREWASNLTIGAAGQHHGFSSAANEITLFLQDYIDDMGITGKVKFWVTGYSRAAAVANLVGHALDNKAVYGSNLSYDSSGVYVYGFETPAGVAYNNSQYRDSLYNNIFSIINDNDLVPKVAPETWNFGRYGIDKHLPTAASSGNYRGLKSNMLQIFNTLPSTSTYVVDDFVMKKISIGDTVFGDEHALLFDDYASPYDQSTFLRECISIIANDFLHSRNSYVQNYQEKIRNIIAVIFGGTEEQIDVFIDTFKKKDMGDVVDVAKSYIIGVVVLQKNKDEAKALKTIAEWVKESLIAAGITNYSEEQLDRAAIDLGELILSLVRAHPEYAATLLNNEIFAAHDPALCYSWLASMDPNYSENPESGLNNGGYRIVRINCAVDVTVYDEEGNAVASILNEEKQDAGTSILCGIDDDGQKIVILPVDENYSIEIKGRENDIVNYGISEYSSKAGGYARNVNYFNVPIQAGEVLTGSIPSYSDYEVENDTDNGSEANYTLSDSEGGLIDADSNLTGEDVKESYCNLIASASNDNWGTVLGSGLHQYGQAAKVEAIARDGFEFVGWKQNGLYVSLEREYRIMMTGDVELVAEFKPSDIFVDVRDETKYYYKSVYWARDNGITKGYAEDNTFRPEEGCTRAQMVTFLWRMAGQPAPSANAKKFPDVASNQYYYKAVLWAAEKGITKGYADGTFKPDETCLREHAMTFLYRYAGKPAVKTTANPFNDIKTSDYYYNACVWASENKIANGYSTGEYAGGFGPKLTCLREHIVTFLYRYAR